METRSFHAQAFLAGLSKEEEFMVMPKVFYTKAKEALSSSTFYFYANAALYNAKSKARKLCTKLYLHTLAEKTDKSTGRALFLFRQKQVCLSHES